MITRRKYKITIVALAMTMLALVGAVIGVWAASNQNLKVGFDVSYDIGENVAVEVRTEYRVAGGEVQTVTQNVDGEEIAGANGYVKFDAVDDGGEKLLNIGNVALSPSAPYVEYFFTVHSLQEEDFVQAAFWIDFATKNNMLLDYWYYNADAGEFDLNSSASTITGWNMNQLDNASALGYKFIKVVLEVGDTNLKASSAGTFNFMLNCDERQQSVSTLSKSKLQEVINADPTTGLKTLTMVYSQLPTGTDISEAGDGSIKISGDTIYSKNTICLPQDSSYLFHATANNEDPIYSNFDLKNIDTSNVTNMECMFHSGRAVGCIEGIEKFNTSNVVDMSGLLYQYMEQYLDLTQFDTSSVTNMLSMFSGSSYQLKKIYVSGLWTVEDVSQSEAMFSACEKLRGAVAYSEDYPDDATMANWETGYLTYKPSRI